ncbi:acyl-CoA dehydrogenase family protein [Nocardia salmonicida]|uniref:acyl-CoA dehydrogenase family protein n=1 Tax=Nocardia salmonicida TaxID=53431 RepID=UPI0033F43278
MKTAQDNSSEELLVRVRDYAEQVLRPAALSTDRDGVLADRIDELRDLGLLNDLAPGEFGGLAIDRDTGCSGVGACRTDSAR